MAINYTRLLRTPGQASYTFDLNGHSPRQKNVFFVRFVHGGSTWERDLGFMVKQTDRPSVTPNTEELNQYNKKRQVYTGYKINPVRIAFYDTVDNTAHRMWVDYSSHYFGDFRHNNAPGDWSHDIINNQMYGNDTGFGFAPLSNLNPDNANYFFQNIDIYQLYGKNYTKYSLINPRVVSFEPDDLDYANSEANVFSMSVQPEAVLYDNNGQPAPIESDAWLVEMFLDKRLSGDTFDLPNDRPEVVQPPSINNDITNRAFADQFFLQKLGPDAVNIARQYDPSTQIGRYVQDSLNRAFTDNLGTDTSLRTYTRSYGTGPLSNYSFGAVTNPDNSDTPPLARDLSYAATTDTQLASTLQIASARRTDTTSSSLSKVTDATKITGISGDRADQATGAVNTKANAGPGARYDSSYMANPAAAAAVSASISRNNAPIDHVFGTDGVVFSDDVYGILNATRKATAQIGVNRAFYAVDPNVGPGALAGSNDYARTKMKKDLAQAPLIAAADINGLPSGNKVTGTIEAGIVTVVSRGGVTLDLYPTLGYDDKMKVDAYRAARQG